MGLVINDGAAPKILTEKIHISPLVLESRWSRDSKKITRSPQQSNILLSTASLKVHVRDKRARILRYRHVKLKMFCCHHSWPRLKKVVCLEVLVLTTTLPPFQSQGATTG